MPDDSTPKPGHFLPGGAGDVPKDSGDAPNDGNPTAPGSTPLGGTTPPGDGDTTSPGSAPGGGSTPLAAPTPRLGAPVQTGPRQLNGSRLGPPPPGDPAANAFKVRYTPEPIPFLPRKRSKAVIAAVVVGVLVVVGCGVAVAAKVLSSYDDFVANPMSTPSVKATDEPSTEPTDGEPGATPTPDVVVEKENKLYGTGKLAAVTCKEPPQRPTSKANVKAYYQALLLCLNKTWEPRVRKAGYDFHPPKLIVFDEGDETACGFRTDVASYCDADAGSVQMPWQDLPDAYSKNKLQTRIDMADALGYVYGHHVQELTGILDAAHNRMDTAPNETAKLEENRRFALQAACLSAVFFGATKATYPLRGSLLEAWQWNVKNSGDESTEDKKRDHGSRKSVELWMNRGFAAADPGSCNTFVAAANKVS